MRRLILAALIIVSGTLATGVCFAQDRETRPPISLHPDNPHYFLFRGKPTVLITSGEHYGAVMNLDFDYKTYLETLRKEGLNHTRLFSGTYRERLDQPRPRIVPNTLAPLPHRYLIPWARSDVPGYFDGGNKFDLAKWDEAYFKRLKDFMTLASRSGVVVEFTFFGPPLDNEQRWKLFPLNAINNVNGVGKGASNELYTLKHKDLVDVQEVLVRKVVGELRGFDNLFYEVCNEADYGGVTKEWERHIVDTIVDAEKDFSHKQWTSPYE